MGPKSRYVAVLVAALTLLAGCLGGVAPTTNAQVQTGTTATTVEQRGISVDASATVEAAPDLAVVRVAVEREADSADAAREQVSDAATEMRRALRQAGIPDDAVTTESYNVFIQYDYRDGEREPDGYRAVHAYRVEVEPDRAGEVIDVAVGNGATRVSGVGFTLSEERRAELREQALTLAVENARADAETMADAADVSVGEVRSLSTSNSNGPVYPVYEARADSAGGATTIEPGEVSVTATVNVVYDVA